MEPLTKKELEDIQEAVDTSNIFYDFEYKNKLGSKLQNADILNNQELRKQIVDLADLWDGQVSGRYGDTLQTVLDSLEIKDVPEFYKKENIDKMIKQIDDHRIIKRLKEIDYTDIFYAEKVQKILGEKNES